MEFSGERVIPGKVEPTLWAEHQARYALAALFAQGRRVLDYGCGTGYGTALLSQSGAALAVGADRALDAVKFASQRFGSKGVSFVAADCLRAGLRDASFDLVVSLETIEHVASYEQYLAEVQRLLAPGGRFILSTPNKRTYSDERPGEKNPFHTHEFYGSELQRILEDRFGAVDLYGQWITEGVIFAKLLSGLGGSQGNQQRLLRFLEPRTEDLSSSCDYLVAICSIAPLSDADREGLDHYFYTSGTNELGEKRIRILQLQQEVEERTAWAQELDRIVESRDEEVHRLSAEVKEGREIADRDDLREPSAENEIQSLTQELAEERARSATLEREATFLAAEVKRLRFFGRRRRSSPAASTIASSRSAADLRSAAGDRSSPSPFAERLLFIQSGSVEKAIQSLEIVRGKVAPNASILYVTHDRGLIPPEPVLQPGTEILVTRVRLRDLTSLAILCRWGGFARTVVLFTGEMGFRRLKLVGLFVASRRLTVFNENGDCFHFTVRKFLRHVLWRLRERVVPGGVSKSLGVVYRVWRDEGTAEVVRRVRNRVRARRQGRLGALRRRRLMTRLRRQTFPECDSPDLTIVIPVHDQDLVTWSCLRSICRNAGDVSYEVVVVDDASGPRTAKMLARHRNVRVVRLDPNQGFVAACNAGGFVARGRFILFLNNDTEVLPDALVALVRTFDEHPESGVVGAKLIFPDGALQEAGGLVWSDGEAWNYGRYQDPMEPSCNYVREVDYCSGAALAVRRELFERLGGFDPQFSPGYWEDTDICFRARAEGFKVLYQPAAAVLHLEGATAGRRTDRGMKAFQLVNQKKFRQRWSEELKCHMDHDPDLVFLARDRRRRKIVLVIDHYVPTPDKDAGSYVMYMVLLSLQHLGYRVLFWPDNLYRTPVYAEDLQARGVEVLYGPLDFREFMEEAAPFLDAVIMHRAKIAHKYLPLVGDRIDRRIYICADLEHVREERRVAVTGHPSEASGSLRAREAAIVSNVAHVAVHSPVEKEILVGEFPGVDVSVLPLPVKIREMAGEPFDRRSGLLFVGSTHPPNVDAVEYFQEMLGPLLRKRLPGVRLTVAGEVSKRISKRPPCPEVDCVGFVPDLGALYGTRRVFIAPLRYGAGIKGKILEAMSFGIPIVTSAVGAEGIGLEPGVTGFVAEEPEEFVEAIARLYEDKGLWYRTRQAARAVIERDYSEASFRERVRRLVDPEEDAAREPSADPDELYRSNSG